jgi:hypothetical protein
MRTARRIRPVTIEQLVERVRREFAALPGLRLTEAQVRRLWSLDPSMSGSVLKRLVDAAYLHVTPSGVYVRADRRREVREDAPALVRRAH